uniref:Methyltransferase type 11 domain-containing protein n=3 Tax=Ditylum brightwellii TaxID=49249 RepID=A0A7S4R6L3_9STRA
MLHRNQGETVPGEAERCGTYKLVADEEARMPFPDGTFDLVISSTALHWVNDLPNMLLEIKRVLKPDGCLMFAMVGGATLTELRSSLVLAELERDGGVSPHVGPFVDFSDVGSLLTSAGFTLPTVDIDTIKIGYPNAMILMEHLQRMGEGNASLQRRERIGVDTFLAASCIYDEMFKLDDDGDDGVEASAQIIYAIGWTPHESQPQPLERGTAKHKVGDVNVVHTETKK